MSISVVELYIYETKLLTILKSYYATKDDVKLFASHGRQLRINISLARKLSCLQYYQLRGKTKLVMVGNLEVKLVNLIVMVALPARLPQKRKAEGSHTIHPM